MSWYVSPDLPNLNERLPESLAAELHVLVISYDGSKLTLACPHDLKCEAKKRVEFIMPYSIAWKEFPKREVELGLKFAYSADHKQEGTGHELLQEFRDEAEE